MKSILYTLVFLFISASATAQTVVDVIVNSEDHTTLEAAVLAADLAGTLSGDGPFTVFAPTDDAFAALPDGTIDALLADPSGDLTDILLYHVVGATVLSSDLSDGQMATTLNGKDITVTISDAGVFINEAQVTVADIETDIAEISLFPNPSADFININISNLNDPVREVVINNIDGKMVKRIDGELKDQIDVSDLNAGVYVVNIVLDKMSYSKKFTIHR